MLELFKHKVDMKPRNADKAKAMELAINNNDVEAVILLYEYVLRKREKKIIQGKEKASMFLKQIPDFSMEMTWEVNIPLLSWLCPSDKCKILKSGANVKLDYTFVGFKNLRSVRVPSTFVFLGNYENKEIMQYDLKQKIYFNPFEPLDDDEKELIIKDIMNDHRINGEFKLKHCDINPSISNWSKKPILDKIEGVEATKYEISITAFANLNKKSKVEYKSLDKDIYWDETKTLNKDIIILKDETEMKNHLANGLKVKNDTMRTALLQMGDNKDKKLKAYVWIVKDSPINAQVN